jgi:NADPH:quinone reductase-like Zn-dependent oxidoreductase
MSATAAVTLPSAILTIALGLYVHLELPMPPTIVPADSWIFVYGGSSASGTMAIQFAKL